MKSTSIVAMAGLVAGMLTLALQAAPAGETNVPGQYVHYSTLNLTVDGAPLSQALQGGTTGGLTPAGGGGGGGGGFVGGGGGGDTPPTGGSTTEGGSTGGTGSTNSPPDRLPPTEQVPAPGALALGVVGLALVGWLRKRA